jgi:hypothetical protein
MSYSKSLIEDIYGPQQPANVSITLTNPNLPPNIPLTGPLQATGAEVDATNLIGAGKAALQNVVTSAGDVGKQTIDYATSKSKGVGSDAMSGALSSLGTTLSKPKNLAALGAGALATGALVGTGATIANRVFGRRKKDKRKR